MYIKLIKNRRINVALFIMEIYKFSAKKKKHGNVKSLTHHHESNRVIN